MRVIHLSRGVGVAFAVILTGCVSIGNSGGGRAEEEPLSGGVVVVEGKRERPEGKFWCPDDIPLSSVTQSGAHADQPTCETARTGANACNGTAIASPNAGCNNHCKQTLGCIGSVRDSSVTVGNSCFPVDDGSGGEDWHYSCVATATCKCI